MSSFQDNFKRDSEEDQLNYDDSAFYYFSMAVLTFVLLPYTYYLFKRFIYGAVELQTEGLQCETEWFQKLLKSKKEEARKSVWTKGYVFRIFCGAFLWYLWYLNFNMVSSIESLQTFDPFQVLEIPIDADVRTIKSAYRKMSIKIHPDKNPDNPLAVSEFIRLTKAYKVTNLYSYFTFRS